MSAAGRVAAGLAAVPALRAAREALAGTADVWVVGGAVRDAAMGRPVTDVDLAVLGEEPGVAAAVATAIDGHAFPLSEEFGVWRVVPREGSWYLDVVRVRGAGIEADLGHRDFTVNAIATPLLEAAGEPELLDPHAGLGDIDRGVLRAVSSRSFSDDPLRLARAARLAAALGLEVDPGTRELAAREAGRAGEPAGERQRGELRGILVGPEPLRAIRLLDELGALAAMLPELDELRGVGQTPYHHVDAFAHSIEVLERLVELQADLAAAVGPEIAAEIEPVLDRELADELSRAEALRFAALLHDVGKAETRSVAPDGRVTFMGHDRLGAEMSRAICARLRASARLADFLASMARNHLRLGFLVHERPLSRRSVFDYLRATQPYSVDVTVLTIPDRLATQGERTKPEAISDHLALAREMLAEALAWDRNGPPRAPLRGDELAAELGIEPGPRLGRLMVEIEARVFAGTVRSAGDAVALAREELEREPD